MGCDNQLLPDTGGPQQSSVLTDPRQRRVLSVLRDRSDPVDIQELATEIAAMETENETSQIQVDLEHRCLPKLESVGWVERDRRRVMAAQPLPFGTGAVLPALDEPDDRFWEAVDALLGHPRRQDLVSMVSDQQHPLNIDELVDELTEKSSWEQYGGPSSVRTLLHHVDLPKLADVGLLEYEREHGQVGRTAFLMMLGNRIDPARGSSEERASCNDQS